jgi:acyl-coenzyme A synthetase/AMP-(fatty) acid ligase
MIYYWARVVPHRPAIIQPEMVTTFQGLADAIDSVGDRIDRLNLNKREPVAVSIANPSFMLATAFALFRSGYGVAPVNMPLYPHLVGAGIRNLIYDTQGQVTSGGRNVRFDMSWLPEPEPGVKRNYRQGPIENADCVFFTSETTGLPKKIIQGAAALTRLLEYPITCASGDHQKILIMPSLISPFGFNRACEILSVGKTVCFAPSAEAVLSLIDLFGIELVVASAAQALSLAKAKSQKPAYQLASLKTLIIDGGEVEPQAVAGISGALCRNVLSQYGSTEAGVVALAPFDAIMDVPGAVGFALPWAEIQIVDEIGTVLQPGAEGLIRYRTPQLDDNIKASGAEAIPSVRDGWSYPGDIGLMTADAVLCLAGRSKTGSRS